MRVACPDRIIAPRGQATPWREGGRMLRWGSGSSQSVTPLAQGTGEALTSAHAELLTAHSVLPTEHAFP